jgi:transcriptional regulator with XRE-family HTH domain
MADQRVTSGSATSSGMGDADSPPALLLARSLRRLRVQQDISLNRLAERSGVSSATLSGLEAGRGNPTLATLLALAPALGVSPGDLLTDACPHHPEAGCSRRAIRCGWR